MGETKPFPLPTEPHKVCFEHPDFLVAYKPHHLLVHRTDWAHEDPDNLKKRLLIDGWASDSDGWLQPVHRLDRPTSGLVVFSRNRVAHAALHQLFLDHNLEKTYFALVRGWLPEARCVIEKPLPTSHHPDPKPALTVVEELERIESQWAMTRYNTTRLSLVRCMPKTGRYHQIRLHLKHLRHPILGDAAHGDRAHNRWLRNSPFDFVLMLHAGQLSFSHGGNHHQISTGFSPSMKSFLDALGFGVHNDIFGSCSGLMKA